MTSGIKGHIGIKGASVHPLIQICSLEPSKVTMIMKVNAELPEDVWGKKHMASLAAVMAQLHTSHGHRTDLSLLI